MAKINIDGAGGGGTVATGVLQLLNGVAMDATLRSVTDQNNTVSPLKLSTTLVQTTSTLKITTADNPYIDAEDNSGNNRFTVGRDPASQQVNVDFASNPSGSTTAVGAIRTYRDGTNLSEAMTFIEDGSVGIGTTAPIGLLDLYKTAAATRLAIRGDAGQNRLISYRTGALQRFGLYVNNTAESGSNAGSNFAIRAYNDAGTLLSTPLFIERSTGFVGVGDSSLVTPTSQLDVIRYTTGSVNNNYQFRVLNSADAVYPISTLLLEHNNRTGVGNQGGASIVVRDGFSSVNRASIDFDYLNSGSYSAAGGSLRLSNAGQGNVYLATNGVDALRVFKDQGVQIGGLTTNLSSVARLHVVGSGSTSATTSLLVQNSGGVESVRVLDNLQVRVNFTDGLTTEATPNITISSSQTGIFSPNPNQFGISCYGNETARFVYGNALHNGALNIGKFANPGNSAFFGWCSDGSLEITGNTQSVFINPTNNSSVVVGASTAQASAILQADSTTKGFLPPRMTTAEKNAIATPAAGLMVYDTTLNKLCVRTAAAWETITSI